MILLLSIDTMIIVFFIDFSCFVSMSFDALRQPAIFARLSPDYFAIEADISSG
jgi:hypothetical protein